MPERVPASHVQRWRYAFLRSAGARHGLVMGAATITAGALDYGVNVLAGRWLEPVDFGIFVSVTAILQVLLWFSLAIRTVIAFYTAEMTGHGECDAQVGTFVRRAWRWSWQWGLVAMALMAVASPPLARWLQLPSSWPLWAASLMVLMLFLRETTLGALQGVQAFTGFGLVQVSGAALRVVFAAGLIWAGGRSVGAIVAHPLSSIGALLVALWWLRPYFKRREQVPHRRVSWCYSMSTLLALTAFGLLTNLDALFVKGFFTPRVAGDYGTVVIFEKISLFLPGAIGLVLFAKVAKRHAAGNDARPILLLALGAALAPGLAVSAVYFVVPGLLVTTIFTRAYADPGIVLGLASLAATLFAGVQIWLYYALSTRRNAFIYVMVGVVVFQGAGMFLFGRESLVAMTVTMVVAGFLGNVGGYLTTWSTAPAAPEADPAIAAATADHPAVQG